MSHSKVSANSLNSSASSLLYYIHDPMCSWCWAFSPTWEKISAALPPATTTQLVLGGLAPDSDQPMPISMQQQLQSTWRRIATVVPGTQFNFDFWQVAKPRRSTYPACRAVLAASAQDSEFEMPMIKAIQNAYYLQAQNPSDVDTLLALAKQIGCDVDLFHTEIGSESIQSALISDIQFAQQLGVPGFPSLVLKKDDITSHYIPVSFDSAKDVLNSIAEHS